MIIVLIMKNHSIEEKNILVKFGSNVRILRNELRISQEELAFQANLDRGYLSDIEKGKRNVSLLCIIKISFALKVDVVKLFEDT